MKYIVIDLFVDEFPLIVSNREGYPKIFDRLADAEQEVRECQKGMIVPLNTHLMNLLKDIRGFINYKIQDEGIEFDEDNLEQQINNFIN